MLSAVVVRCRVRGDVVDRKKIENGWIIIGLAWFFCSKCLVYFDRVQVLAAICPFFFSFSFLFCLPDMFSSVVKGRGRSRKTGEGRSGGK